MANSRGLTPQDDGDRDRAVARWAEATGCDPGTITIDVEAGLATLADLDLEVT